MKQLLLPTLFFLSAIVLSCQPTEGPDQEAEVPQQAEMDAAEQVDTIPYEMRTYTDTLFADPSDPEAPTAKFAETWVVAKSADENLNQLVFSSIADETVFEAGNLMLDDPEGAFEESKSWFFSAFEETYAEIKDLMGYDSETGMHVELNDGKWFTLSISNFSYTGGAHGNYGTSYLTIDVENRKRLRLEDVFKPGYESVLVPILEKKVREHFEMEPDAPLENFLFENKIPVTENFGLMENGILFDYPPYEIASYAAGEIDLLITYEELADILLIEP
jgi:hypothetical protein